MNPMQRQRPHRWRGRARPFARPFMWGLALALGLTLAVAAPLWAHAPRYHQAALVEFERPVPAPAFRLSAMDGAPVRLEDFRGRFVLVNFWATWCPPCVREMPTLERLSQLLAEEPFTVLAVSVDAEGAAKVRPFLARLGVTFPVALDPQSRAAGRYGANDLPATFLVDPQGRVIVAAKGERDWADPKLVEYLREVIARPL